jgi:dipeptidase
MGGTRLALAALIASALLPHASGFFSAMGGTRLALAALIASALLPHASDACTAIGVGRLASSDGSVMVAHTDDSGGMGDPRLARVPARDWPAGAMRPVYLAIADYPRMIAPERSEAYAPLNDKQKTLPWVAPIGHVPQVNHTYAYWDVDYGLGNEHGLVLAETTCAGRWGAAPVGQPNGTALFSIEELSKLALERCKNARCAVSTMGEMAEQYGYYGGNSHLGQFQPWPGTQSDEEGEALIVGDAAGELWVFHVLPGPDGGAVWAAQRMPEDSVTIVANMFVIRQMDLSDPSRYRASKGIVELAQRLGLNRAEFDFTEAFSGDFKAPSRVDALVGSYYTGRRVWRVFDLLAPSLRLDPELGSVQEMMTYPQYIVPEAPVSPARVMAMLRDHFEGTAYDLTQGMAAGPYGSVSALRARGSALLSWAARVCPRAEPSRAEPRDTDPTHSTLLGYWLGCWAV